MKRHQALIEEAALPDAAARFRGSQLASDLVTAWGYERIGIDHFALPHDPLVQAARSGQLRRNFQGYTDDFLRGACRSRRLGGRTGAAGLLQNAVPVDEYGRRIAARELPVTRGVALGAEDRVRAYAIERLMCDFRLNWSDLSDRFGRDAAGVIAEADAIVAADADGVMVKDGDIPHHRARPAVRALDLRQAGSLFRGRTARHSLAV